MYELCFDMLTGEVWWGGVANCGSMMPLTETAQCTIDPCGADGADLDQNAPLFVSSKGRSVWSESSFAFQASKGHVKCEGDSPILLDGDHISLREAYVAACRSRFPFSGKLPDQRFFALPQYNTWIELGTQQTQEAILAYAHGILAHGLPAGILMIDEGWQVDYGVFDFNRSKIPDPAKLVETLHELGFAVMLWVTPLIAAAGDRFKMLKKADFLLKDHEGSIAVREWWNGFSALLDLTNENAWNWLNAQLHSLMSTYGIDGFKFDAGDRYFYRDDDQTCYPISAREQTKLYNRFGACYALNEFRAAWNFGGQEIVSRLQDKMHSWGRAGLQSLIPNAVVQGLLGYAYCCPDMVGGGDIGSFDEGQPMDEELFVRWAQASACMGMMQMSIAPWRVLTPAHAALVASAMAFHYSLGEEIMSLAAHSAKTGEPIVRAMDYCFPNEGFESVTDQFMLGDALLAAPVLEKGARERTVRLPKGQWNGWNGVVYEGGCSITIPVTIEDIPCFRRK